MKSLGKDPSCSISSSVELGLGGMSVRTAGSRKHRQACHSLPHKHRRRHKQGRLHLQQWLQQVHHGLQRAHTRPRRQWLRRQLHGVVRYLGHLGPKDRDTLNRVSLLRCCRPFWVHAEARRPHSRSRKTHHNHHHNDHISLRPTHHRRDYPDQGRQCRTQYVCLVQPHQPWHTGTMRQAMR